MSNRRKQFWGLVTLSLMMFIVTLDTTITNIALPDITSAFHSNLTDTNWISTIYVLVMAVMIIPAAKFGDQFGRKRITLIGLLLFGLGSLMCGLSKDLIALIIMRFFQGFGGAIVTPIVIPLATDLFGRKKATQAVGIIGAVTAVAAAAGPAIGGLLLQFLNWQWIFFVNVPIVLITILLLELCFNESVDPTISRKIDFGGILFLTLTLAQLTYVLIKGHDMGWLSSASISLVTGSIIACIIFLIVEHRSTAPLIEFGLFKERTFTASTIIYLMCGFAIVCSSLIFNFYLENVRNYSALNASYIIMFMSLTVMFSMPLGSKLATAFGYRGVITIGMLMMAASLFLLTSLSAQTTKLMMILLMLILGFGFGFACLSIVSAVQFIPEAKAGIASGIVNAARQLGTALGIALLVGTMTSNIDTVKKQLKTRANHEIAAKQLPQEIADLIHNRLNTTLNTTQLTKQSDLATDLKHILSRKVNTSATLTVPKNQQLKQLHNGLSQLSEQFSNQPGTIGHASRQLAQSQPKLSQNFMTILYTTVKNDPTAQQTLHGYQSKLAQLSKLPASKIKRAQQQQLLSMVLVYQTGTNPQVTNAQQFVQVLEQQLGRRLANKQAPIQTNQTAHNKLSTALSANGALNQAVVKLNTGISKIDLKQRLTQLFQQLKTAKNLQLTHAFTNTFLLAAIILTLFTAVGLFTDRPRSN